MKFSDLAVCLANLFLKRIDAGSAFEDRLEFLFRQAGKDWFINLFRFSFRFRSFLDFWPSSFSSGDSLLIVVG